MGVVVDTVSDLRGFVAPEFVCGIGARKLIGQYPTRYPLKRILLVSDPGVVAVGWTQDVAASLEEAGLPYSYYRRDVLRSVPVRDHHQHG